MNKENEIKLLTGIFLGTKILQSRARLPEGIVSRVLQDILKEHLNLNIQDICDAHEDAKTVLSEWGLLKEIKEEKIND